MYVDRTRCAWRYLPADFPPWRTVYGYFAAWRDDGTLTRLHDVLRAQVRAAAGRDPQPTAAVIDSQSARAANTVPLLGLILPTLSTVPRPHGAEPFVAVEQPGLRRRGGRAARSPGGHDLPIQGRNRRPR